MAIAAAAIRTSIIEAIEGAGPFSYGAFAGMPTDTLMAKLRQTSTAEHWFDVQIAPATTSAQSNVASIGSRYLMELDVTVQVYTGLATPAQESARSTVLDAIGSDCSDAARALSRPGALAETAAGSRTDIVGGCTLSTPSWRLLRENWSADASHTVHELRGKVAVYARIWHYVVANAEPVAANNDLVTAGAPGL